MAAPRVDELNGKKVLIVEARTEAEADAGVGESGMSLVIARAGSMKTQIYLFAETALYERYLPVFKECLRSIKWVG